jgi:hypothetical protein
MISPIYKNFIKKALFELIYELKDVQNAFEPAKLAVEVSSRNDTTLQSASCNVGINEKKTTL